MSAKEICKKTITAIKLDVTEIYKELSETPLNKYRRREQILQSIIYANEIIDDLNKIIKRV